MKSKHRTVKSILFFVSVFFYTNLFSQNSSAVAARNHSCVSGRTSISKGVYAEAENSFSNGFLPVYDTIRKKDRDRDGIIDSLDKCPDERGVIEFDGCPIPDSDNDGVADNLDNCPTIAGLVKYKGCPVPDKDGDKINDEDDKCPDQPGVARYEGCLVGDKDKDGVNDDDDKCIDVAGTINNAGCPENKKSSKPLTKTKKK
jgi:hypothetical protein